MHRSKRGQVTLFVIIAIVVVAAIVISIVVWRNLRAEVPEPDIAKVKNYLTSCLSLRASEGILLLGKQGGYFNLDSVESLVFIDEETAYYWKDNQDLIPTTETVQNELSDYLNRRASECFVETEAVSYEVNLGDCVSSSFVSDKATMTFNCPITVKKGAAASRISSFSLDATSSIPKLLDVSSQVLEEYKKDPGWLCIECLDQIATANDVTIKAVPVTKEVSEPEHVWFLITDKNINLEDKDLKWRFVAEL